MIGCMVTMNDVEWVGAVAYARAAGARGYDEAYAWVVEAFNLGIYTTYNHAPADMAMAYRRIDELAARDLAA